MKELLISGIYKITNPNKCVYIGQSEDLIKRENNYKTLGNIKNQIRIYNSIKFYGWENHTFEIQERCEVEQLNRRERFWQDFYDVIGPMGLNCVLQDADEKRKVYSEETRKKMSLSNRSKEPEIRKKMSEAAKGRKHTQETKDKLRIHNLGKKQSEESIRKKILSTTGQKRTDETKLKMSLAAVGRKFSAEHVKKLSIQKEIPILQFDLEDNFIKEWESITKVAEEICLKTGKILHNCRNGIGHVLSYKRNTAYGFKWKYKNKI